MCREGKVKSVFSPKKLTPTSLQKERTSIFFTINMKKKNVVNLTYFQFHQKNIQCHYNWAIEGH